MIRKPTKAHARRTGERVHSDMRLQRHQVHLQPLRKPMKKTIPRNLTRAMVEQAKSSSEWGGLLNFEANEPDPLVWLSWKGDIDRVLTAPPDYELYHHSHPEDGDLAPSPIDVYIFTKSIGRETIIISGNKALILSKTPRYYKMPEYLRENLGGIDKAYYRALVTAEKATDLEDEMELKRTPEFMQDYRERLESKVGITWRIVNARKAFDITVDPV